MQVATAVAICAVAALILFTILHGAGTATAAVPEPADTTSTGTTTTGSETGSLGNTTQASPIQTTQLAPAPTQTDPTSPWDATPIPAVVSAVKLAQAGASLPTTILPPLGSIDNVTYATPAACQPTFGPGVTARQICRLGDPTSRRVVVMIGDSHSNMWDPAIISDAAAHGFAVVPLAKSGCQLSILHLDSTGWPCASWYRWALAEDKRLHPLATIVSFLYKQGWESAPAAWVKELQGVLDQVTSPVLITDPPYQNAVPAECVSTAGATQRTCSSPVPSTYVPFVQAIASMAVADRVPIIPTLQWFCSQGTCPMLIDDTITTRDKDHLTMDYVEDLTRVFSLALNPILARLQNGR
jgi:hypothetical protein